MHLETNLTKIEQQSVLLANENDEFRKFLQRQNTRQVDEIVQQLNETVAPNIDCLQCGNCCRSLMINVEPGELQPIASHLQMDINAVQEKFIETSQGGKMVMNSIPCAFLSGNACTVYESRFSECRNFPHLDRPHFTDRLFGTLMHYGRCPIIYNVIEKLKIKLNFRLPSTGDMQV